MHLVLLVEQQLGAEITAENMEELRTIGDRERCVAERTAARASGGV
ncbi:hypothetical protein [Streptomyces sp. OP7]